MAEQSYEAIVVGAGPAGSAAAVALARAGRSVLVLDKAAFPRDKPCGDLIGARAMRAARRPGIDARVLEAYPPLLGAHLTTSKGELDLVPGSRLGSALLRSTDARVVPRLVFDAAMIDAALRAGAELRTGHVRRVSLWDGTGREVQLAGGQRLRAGLIVLAAGYGSRVIAGPSDGADDPPRGIAMRAYFAGVRSPARRIAFALNEWVLPGYGWVFPLPDGRANVGIGTLVHDSGGQEHLRDLYRRFTTDPASPAAPWLVDAVESSPPRSWPLDLGPRRGTVIDDGFLVAGEAAGLVGPLTGAGIAFALLSGEAAGVSGARALSSGDPSRSALSDYARSIQRHFLPWLRAEGAAQRWLGHAEHMNRLLRITRQLPPTGTLGARMLLHLG